MFEPITSFSGFSVKDLAQARAFYTGILGIQAEDASGGFHLCLPQGHRVFVYIKPNHEAATYTILNFVVADIDAAVAELVKRGVVFERYPGLHQDDQGISRGRAANMGPDIAWFKDPAGNILSLIQS